MYTKAIVISAWPALAAALVAFMLFAGNVEAGDQEFTVAYRVSTEGLDPAQPAGAHEFYSRLKHAAEVVCTHGNRVGLAPVADPKRCYEKALGTAVRSANLKLVTQIYLQTHTLQEAAAFGIDAPVQVATN